MFENESDTKVHTKYYLSKQAIKCYNVLINEKSFYDQADKSDIITYGNIRNIATDQEDDYKNFYLLDYNYFKKHYKLIAIDLSKQQALDADPKPVQQINFTGNLEGNAGATFFLKIFEESNEGSLDFSQGTIKCECRRKTYLLRVQQVFFVLI